MTGPPEQQPHLSAEMIGDGSIYQAGRDQHIHYDDGWGPRRAASDSVVDDCPYPGLTTFDEEQARWFFGRDPLVAELIDRLDDRLRDGGLLLVVAPSGAGKSSLLRAGLLPALVQGRLAGSQYWRRVLLTPTSRPMATLATHLATATGVSPQWVASTMAADPVRYVTLLQLTGIRLAIVVDQFEELFTHCAVEAERRAFLDVLRKLAATDPAGRPPIAVVAGGLRADFYARCADYPELWDALRHRQVLVGPMSPDQLRAAITCPARDVGLDIEPGLIDVLLTDLGATRHDSGYEAGRLPLLAHALRTTWQQRHSHILTTAGYRITGGIHGAVATTAERAYQGLTPAGQQAARIVFLRLVSIGDGTDDTRRRIPHTTLVSEAADPPTTAAVVDAFTSARLLTQQEHSLEITHDALLRAWPRLQIWINSDRDGNLVHQQLEDAASTWTRTNHDSATLYLGSRLDTARTWAITHPPSVSPAVREFLTASIRQQRRSFRLRRTAVVLLAVLALFASGAAAVAFHQSAVTRQQRDDAVFNQVTAEAGQLPTTDLSLAAQLDLVAHRMRPTDLNTDTALINTENIPLSMTLTDHRGAVNAVQFSPKGGMLASASEDGTVRLWNVRDPAHPAPLGRPLLGHRGGVETVAFSPDGQVLASGGKDSTVRLWDIRNPADPEPLGSPLTMSGAAVTELAFDPRGGMLAGAGNDGSMELWDVTDSRQVTSMGSRQDHTQGISGLAFSPHGHLLATAGLDQSATLWNVTDRAHPLLWARLPETNGIPSAMHGIAFRPDGNKLISGSADGDLWTFDISDPMHPRATGYIFGSQTGETAVAYSPDGQFFATASSDRTVRLWYVAGSDEIPIGPALTGYTGAVDSVAFSPDSHTLATASVDDTIRLWNLPRTVMSGHTNGISSLAYSGHILASASTDNTVRLWNMADPLRPVPLGRPLTGATNYVNSVAFSPDGHVLASGSSDGTIRLWDMSDPAHARLIGQPLTMTIPEGAPYQGLVNGGVTAVAFSPVGHLLAAGGLDLALGDGLIQMWNIADPKHPTADGQAVIGSNIEVSAVAFLGGRLELAASGDSFTTEYGWMRLWNVANQTSLKVVSQQKTGYLDYVNAIAVNSNGTLLASSGSDGSIQIWDVRDPTRSTRLGMPLTGPSSNTGALAFDHAGNMLVSGSADKTLRLWNVTDPTHTTQLGLPLMDQSGSVGAVLFSPDGDTIINGDNVGLINVWNLNVNVAVQRICATTNNITPQQWQHYVGNAVAYSPPCPRP